MKKTKRNIFILILGLVLAFIPTINVKATNEKVYLGGFPAGFIINTEGAEVVGLCNVFADGIAYSPSKEAGILVGDIITGLNGKTIKGAADIEKALEGFKGEITNINIIRADNNIILPIQPFKDLSMRYKIGLFVRDTMTGVGTITYVKQKDLAFGALGHPVLNQSGDFVNIQKSQVYLSNIIGVTKGIKGRPGELKGVFIKDKVLAVANKNTKSGIFGTFEKDNNVLNKDMLIDIGSTAKPGNATIMTTILGSIPIEYSISIVKVDKNESQNKNLVIKITDKKLLNEAGGILQGMSGSPIIQDNKLVGAVTHVFVNDPTRGFGILIDKMLNE